MMTSMFPNFRHAMYPYAFSDLLRLPRLERWNISVQISLAIARQSSHLSNWPDICGPSASWRANRSGQLISSRKRCKEIDVWKWFQRNCCSRTNHLPEWWSTAISHDATVFVFEFFFNDNVHEIQTLSNETNCFLFISHRLNWMFNKNRTYLKVNQRDNSYHSITYQLRSNMKYFLAK